MTDSEFSQLWALMRACWPHVTLPEMTQQIAKSDLADHDAVRVLAAVRVIYRDGAEWPPNGAKILEKLAELDIDAPDWGSVKAELVRSSRVDPTGQAAPEPCPLEACDGSGLIEDWDTNTAYDCRCRPQVIRRARQRRSTNEVVAAFLDHVGGDELRDVIAGDRTAEAQVRTKYEAFIRDRVRDTTWQGLATGGLPALERRARAALTTTTEAA